MAIPAHDILRFWRLASVAAVRSDQPDLTQRQMAILLIVYLTEGPHTVRGLSAQLNVAKPVVTRALDALGRMSLLKRARDPKDKRSVLVQRTMGGMAFLNDLEHILSDAQSGANTEVAAIESSRKA